MAIVNTIALELVQEFEEATDDGGFVARVELRINEALDEIAVATNWNHFRARTTIPTVNAQAQYNLPIGAREIIQLHYIDNGEPIPLLTKQEAARRSIKLTDTGRPRAWLEDGTILVSTNILYRVRLWPVPTSAIDIEYEYYYHPSEVPSGSSLPVQDQLIVLVKDRVRAHLLELDQKYEAADRAQRRYETNLDRLVKQERQKVAEKTTLQEVDLANIRRRRGPRLPGNYPDYW